MRARIRLAPPIRRSPSALYPGIRRTDPRGSRILWFLRHVSGSRRFNRGSVVFAFLIPTCPRWTSDFDTNAHHRRLFTAAAWRGLEPAPGSGLRRAFLHLSCSLCTIGQFIANLPFLRLRRTLNAPVPADRPDQDSGIIVAACQEVADLGLDRAGAVDAPDRLDCENRTQVRPAVQGLEILDRRGHEDAPAHQAAVALVKGVEHRSPLASPAKTGLLELLAHSPKGAAVIGLEHQEVVGALGPDLRGDVLLAAHGVQRHNATLQVQGLQQLRDRDDLIRLAVDCALTKRQSLFAGPSADHVQRPMIVAAAASAPDGLAVH